MAAELSVVEDTLPTYGAMRSTMSDHVYVPHMNASIYSSPCIVASVTTPFDVFMGITACRQSFSINSGGQTVEGNALVHGPRERFLHARGVKLICVQLDPFHPSYRLMRRQPVALSLDRDALTPFDDHLNAAYEGTLSLSDSQDLYNAALAELTRRMPALPELDRRVKNVMHLLYDNPRLAVEELASKNQLSYDRMSHLFMDELGISIRSFQVWVKLNRALNGVHYGVSLIELARKAGFSDAAHLSRVYKQVYGAPPSYFYFSGNVKLMASINGAVPGTELPTVNLRASA